MAWVEFVRLRTFEDHACAALPALRTEVESLTQSLDDADTLLLQHGTFGGDVAILIIWNNQRPPKKSRPGLLLARSLEHLGAVNHAVWRSALQSPDQVHGEHNVR